MVLLKESSPTEPNIFIVGASPTVPPFRRLFFLEHPSKPQDQSANPEHTPSESPDQCSLLQRRLGLEARCERRATETEQELIRQTLPLLYDFVGSIGGAPKQVHPGRIRFYDVSNLNHAERSLLTEPGVKGAFRPLHGTILIFSDPTSQSLLETADLLVHEVLHSQAFSNMDADSVPLSNEHTRLPRQQNIGIRIIRPDQAKTYFKNLDEAVITTLTIRFLNQYGNMIPSLAHEFQRRTQFIEALPEGVRERARREIARIVQIPPDSEGGIWRTEVIPYPYPNEREEMNRLITELLEKNVDDLADSDKVFQVFVQAVLKGKLLPLASLVEKTLGRGSFGRLGEQRDRMLSERS